VPVVIAYIDAQRRFRFHNKATEQSIGLKAGQIQGRTMREVFGGEVYETLRPKVDKVLTGAPVRFQHVLANALGELRDYAVHYFLRYSGDTTNTTVMGFMAWSRTSRRRNASTA
jgi:PAS domain S-box-containing protein